MVSPTTTKSISSETSTQEECTEEPPCNWFKKLCQNGSTCKSDGCSSITCTCTDYYEGKHCEIRRVKRTKEKRKQNGDLLSLFHALVNGDSNNGNSETEEKTHETIVDDTSSDTKTKSYDRKEKMRKFYESEVKPLKTAYIKSVIDKPTMMENDTQEAPRFAKLVAETDTVVSGKQVQNATVSAKVTQEITTVSSTAITDQVDVLGNTTRSTITTANPTTVSITTTTHSAVTSTIRTDSPSDKKSSANITFNSTAHTSAIHQPRGTLKSIEKNAFPPRPEKHPNVTNIIVNVNVTSGIRTVFLDDKQTRLPVAAPLKMETTTKQHVKIPVLQNPTEGVPLLADVSIPEVGSIADTSRWTVSSVEPLSFLDSPMNVLRNLALVVGKQNGKFKDTSFDVNSVLKSRKQGKEFDIHDQQTDGVESRIEGTAKSVEQNIVDEKNTKGTTKTSEEITTKNTTDVSNGNTLLDIMEQFVFNISDNFRNKKTVKLVANAASYASFTPTTSVTFLNPRDTNAPVSSTKSPRSSVYELTTPSISDISIKSVEKDILNKKGHVKVNMTPQNNDTVLNDISVANNIDKKTMELPPSDQIRPNTLSDIYVKSDNVDHHAPKPLKLQQAFVPEYDGDRFNSENNIFDDITTMKPVIDPFKRISVKSHLNTGGGFSTQNEQKRKRPKHYNKNNDQRHLPQNDVTQRTDKNIQTETAILKQNASKIKVFNFPMFDDSAFNKKFLLPLEADKSTMTTSDNVLFTDGYTTPSLAKKKPPKKSWFY